MLHTPPSDHDHRPRKKMRKGTHRYDCYESSLKISETDVWRPLSCSECRRRKIRCVPTPSSNTCNECLVRGTQCIDQERSDVQATSSSKRKNMRERAEELEGMVSEILGRLDFNANTGYSQIGDSERGAAEALRSLQLELQPSTLKQSSPSTTAPRLLSNSPEASDISSNSLHQFDNAPVMRLFDSAVLGQKENNNSFIQISKPTGGYPRLSEADNRFLKGLKALMPNNNDLVLILRSNDIWRDIWRRAFPFMLRTDPDGPQAETFRDHILESLNSTNVGAIAKILLCLALCFQQLPKDPIYGCMSLPASPEALQNHYMTSVDSLLGSDDDLASSLDGLECMILQMQFYMDVGKARKAWLISRRAVSFAHLTGRYRHVHSANDFLSCRKRTLWMHLCLIDRSLSLVLGLPYAISESHIEFKTSEDEKCVAPDGERALLRLCVIAGHTIDCNQELSQVAYSNTLKIDQELEEWKSTMPATWWDASPVKMSVESIFDMYVAKCLYHNIRKILHLPFMLKSFMDRRFEFSRIATLESSRALIDCYQILRDERRPALLECNLLDFLAFTAAMALVLNLLSSSEPPCHNPSQEEDDWNIIKGLIAVLKRASRDGVSTVARQSAKILEDFYERRHGCDASHCDTYQTVVPYFGRITLRAGDAFGSRNSLAPVSQADNQPNASRESIGNLIQPGVGPLISFDSYLQPTTGLPYPTQDLEIDWTSIVNLDLNDDWSWFNDGIGTM
ncbi:hypothetical protein MMC06_006632 [Schaereria dolodes]|nr:hypothetical protein [Schaereria dolodes]